MKENSTAHWSHRMPVATNSSGFTALPGGTRYCLGEFLMQVVTATGGILRMALLMRITATSVFLWYYFRGHRL